MIKKENPPHHTAFKKRGGRNQVPSPSLLDLPLEVLLAIGSTTETRALLARTNRALYAIFNPLLYEANLFHSERSNSCILWGAQYGVLGTVKLGHRYGGDLDVLYNHAFGLFTAPAGARGTGSSRYNFREASPLLLATQLYHSDIVAYLLEHGANVHRSSGAVCRCDGIDWLYPLHLVACRRSPDPWWDLEKAVEVALQLIRGGAYYHAVDRRPGLLFCRPAFPMLVEFGRRSLVKALLKQPELDRWFDKRTALTVAAKHGQTDIARDLLDDPRTGLDVEAVETIGFLSEAAVVAARLGHAETLKFFLETAKSASARRVDPGTDLTVAGDSTAADLVGWKGMATAAFHAAVVSNKPLIMKFLLEFGVCADEPTSYGSTALHVAAALGHAEAALVLIGRTDVDVNAVCLSGRTPLRKALVPRQREPSEQPTVTIVEALIAAGGMMAAASSADDDDDDDENHAPARTAQDAAAITSCSRSTNLLLSLRLAIENKRPRTALSLLALGADPSLDRGPYQETRQSLLCLCMSPTYWPMTDHELALVKKLIKAGADLAFRSQSPEQPREPIPPLAHVVASGDGRQANSCLSWILEAAARAHPNFSLADTELDKESGDDASHPSWAKSLLMLLFNKRLRQHFHAALPTRLLLEDVRCVEFPARLLLKYGARLDVAAGVEGMGMTALRYSCEVALDGCFVLLCLLLQESTGRNVSREHVDAMKKEYAPRDFGCRPESREDSKRIQRRCRVFRLLCDFRERAFGKIRVVSVGVGDAGVGSTRGSIRTVVNKKSKP